VGTTIPEEPTAFIFRRYMSQVGKWGNYMASAEEMVNLSH
jgi:hypothetical protein